ncbi:MAG TPA: ABC-F family ATP-binding cassette domain-containing protein [Rhodothermales bacterium]|nr:ABC-F family ATP-binding cassette domain-containing protein [Rhodothermales bacterium]
MVQLENISLSFGGQRVFDTMSWFIRDGARVGLIGPNGAGKTTLLRMLAGQMRPDSGSVSFGSEMTIGYLEQEILEVDDEDESVRDHVLRTFDRVQQLELASERILERLKQQDLDEEDTDRLIRKLDEIHVALHAHDAHLLESRAETVLHGLGFTDDDLGRTVASFSGGWRMRMALAQLLLKRPDLLLLDEPTNHLDIESIDWLEQFLASFPGAVVLVSHDRYFLNRIVSSIAEIAHGRINNYTGNYERYELEKEERLAIQWASYENQQREIKQAEQFIRRFRAKATKARQVQSRIKALERIDLIPEPEPPAPSIRFSFPSGSQPSRVVLSLSDFSKSYDLIDGGEVVVFDRARAMTIERGEKIALVGKNGAGKSTLARILGGTEPFDGERKLGQRVDIGFFAQNQSEALDPGDTVLQAMQRAAYGWDEARIRGLLGAFLFSADDVLKRTSVLSGGEKSRLALALTLATPANFLVLDEPTNHLDIRSRAALIEALREFPGTFVVISHDRHFVDRVANRIWYVADGQVRVYHGNYSGIVQLQATAAGPEAKTRPEVEPAASNGRGGGPKTKEQKRIEAERRKAKASQKDRIKTLIVKGEPGRLEELDGEVLQFAMELLEEKIAAEEEERSTLEGRLADPTFYYDSDKSATAVHRFEDLQRSLATLYERWELVARLLEDERSNIEGRTP